jgi:hypothetical protein
MEVLAVEVLAIEATAEAAEEKMEGEEGLMTIFLNQCHYCQSLLEYNYHGMLH